MKTQIAAALSIAFLFAACAPEPQQVIIERHHYHAVRPSPTVRKTPSKASPNVGGGTSEGFRAVERAD